MVYSDAAGGEIVGRDEELARLGGFVDRVANGPAALVLEGEAGIGKTTLWRTAVQEGGRRGFKVLSCRPAASETRVSFAGLSDLLGEEVDEVMAGLPAPQRRALGVALRRECEGTPDALAIGNALASSLRRLANAQPVLVAIDDVQWLDAPSARVLAFALRRRADLPVGVLLAPRSAGAVPFDLDVATEAERVFIGPLDLDALHHLARAAGGKPLARPELMRVAPASGGNPLVALEIVRALGLPGVKVEAGVPLPVPDSIRALLRRRLDGLSTSDRRLLLLIAAAPVTTTATLESWPGGTAALERWEAARLVDVDAGQVRFSHPLIGSTLYEAASSAQRRAAQRALAEAAGDREAHARHLALATQHPDAAVATILDEAATLAVARGAPDAAAELAELALQLTPPGSHETLRRRLALAERRFRAGDASVAEQLASAVVEEAAGSQQAEALLVLAEIEDEAGSGPDAYRMCEAALACAGGDHHLRARLHGTAAMLAFDDPATAARHARSSLMMLDASGDADPATRCLALQTLITSDLFLGRDFRRDDTDVALALEREAPPAGVVDRPSAALGVWLSWVDELDAARAALEATWVCRTVEEEGDDSSLAYPLSHLSQVELRAGNLTRALALASKVVELSEQTGRGFQRAQALYLRAVVEAHLGELDLARADANEFLAYAEAARSPWALRNACHTLGLIELTAGDASASRALLERSVALRRQIGLADPGQAKDVAHLIEALAELGDVVAAAPLVEELACSARRLESPCLAGQGGSLFSLGVGSIGRPRRSSRGPGQGPGSSQGGSLPIRCRPDPSDPRAGRAPAPTQGCGACGEHRSARPLH